MHKFKNSLKYQFIILTMISIFVPVLIILWLMPSFYNIKNQKQIITLTKSNLQSIASNLSTYIEDLNTYTTSPYFHEKTLASMKTRVSGKYKLLTPYEQLLSDRDFTQIVDKFANQSRKEILSTLLICLDGSVAASSKYDGYLIEDYPFASQKWYKDTLLADGKNVFTGHHQYDYFSMPSSKQAFSISRLIKDPNSQKPLGVIIASADTRVFSKLTSKINLGVSSVITILDADSNVIYSTKDLPSTFASDLKSETTDLHYASDKFIQISYPIENSPWKLMALISQKDLNKQTSWMYLIAIFFACLALVILAVVFLNFSSLIIGPFGQMKAIMNGVKKGDLTKRFVPKRSNEISELGLELNDMISKLDRLIEKEYKMALSAKIAEYNSLCSQIQPHFLFNTLSGFIGLNRLGEKEKLEKAIFSLTSMLRYSLDTNDLTTLEKEFSFVQSYLSLQQLRFEDRFDVVLHYDSKLKNFPIPKLLLQPFVENSIIHGIEPSEDYCHISIVGEIVSLNHQNLLHLEVKDTGVGFCVGSHIESIGLTNPKERLLFTYSKATLDITSQKGDGTIISILIPLPKENEHESINL